MTENESQGSVDTNESVFPIVAARNWPYFACQMIIPGWFILVCTVLIIFKTVPEVTLEKEL